MNKAELEAEDARQQAEKDEPIIVTKLVLTAKQQREIAYGLNPVIPSGGVTSGALNPSRPYRRSWLGRPKAAR